MWHFRNRVRPIWVAMCEPKLLGAWKLHFILLSAPTQSLIVSVIGVECIQPITSSVGSKLHTVEQIGCFRSS